MTLQVSTDNLSIAGDYIVTLTMLTPGGKSTNIITSFELSLVNACLSATLTIDSQIVPSDPIEYTIGELALT